jgi:hypothetical protein
MLINAGYVDLKRVAKGLNTGLEEMGYPICVNVCIEHNILTGVDEVYILTPMTFDSLCLRADKDIEEIVELFSRPYDYTLNLLSKIGEM